MPHCHSNALALLLAGAALAVDAAPAPSCELHTLRHDRREVTCSIEPADSPQDLRLTATFTGSHDDTSLFIAPTLNGQPIQCDVDSKPTSEREDGEITLTCNFTVPGNGDPDAMTNGRHQLRALLSFHHAEYANYTLERQGPHP